MPTTTAARTSTWACSRPCCRPAVGGRPALGRTHFERAIELSGGRHLLAKVLFAEHYARLVFDRELHDQLLTEVLAADIEAEGLTLMNAIAREQAPRLAGFRR